jgi:2-keto-4-pentenoate hydratase/2-oxohepta-3-ene-1,7-dioic acid hydratase in catechol pathway
VKIIRWAEGGQTGYGELRLDQVFPWSNPPWLGGAPLPEEPKHRASVSLLVPCEPSKIVCVGRNYVEHARELGNDVPKEPLLFFKPPTSLLPAGGAVLLPAESERVEHEGELAVVIGRALRRATPEAALAAIAGYTCFNDVTARDLQRRDVQFTRGKGFDTFAPCGPWVETELDLAAAELVTRVNGEVRQRGWAHQMVFSVPVLLAYISQVMTLLPGDVVATGTPAGVGPLMPGDRVEIEIAGIGTLSHTVELEA